MGDGAGGRGPESKHGPGSWGVLVGAEGTGGGLKARLRGGKGRGPDGRGAEGRGPESETGGWRAGGDGGKVQQDWLFGLSSQMASPMGGEKLCVKV